MKKKSSTRKGNFQDKGKPIRPEKPYKAVKTLPANEPIRLNKFIANAGICSRREADALISSGEISVNGKIIQELGQKVSANDRVEYKGARIFMVENPVYILLNKPKDTITTNKDPEGRKTVLSLIKDATAERVYPVGRLDRNTTGVLLLTNDGEMAQRLTHPSRKVKKVYAAELDKAITEKHMQELVDGVELEDGKMFADVVAWPDPLKKHVVGIEIHSGKNRVVRRLFEHLGYSVIKLDRVLFADLDKRKLKKGEWRYLTDREVRSLKNSVGLRQ